MLDLIMDNLSVFIPCGLFVILLFSGYVIWMTRTKRCTECGGYGRVQVFNNTSACCPSCNGSGRILK